ncbi:HNH endonuclease [Acinetobacter sp.]|uniref:HNH endonuclease n=1 Tax=Acinetobacter sp. TaxID=472 RepID=UPI003752EBB4
MMEAKKLAKRDYKGANKKQKFEYQCNHCKKWFKDSEVQVDHKIPVGSLLSWEDITPFLQKLIPEGLDAFQVLCKECHQVKTNKEREER